MKYIVPIILLFVCYACANDTTNSKIKEETKLKALIIDGQNNHGIWPKTTMMMQEFLRESKIFDVDIYRISYTWQGPHSGTPTGLDSINELMALYPLKGSENREVVKEPKADSLFAPKWSNYDVVISNLGWNTAPWPEETQKSFEKYMMEGGGLVAVHAANNAFPEWEEFNKMIGLGGWADRKGTQLFYTKDEQLGQQYEEKHCGSHGPEMEFIIKNRAPEHPIMKGIPMEWLHTKDELYERLCGPAENVTILATSFSDKEGNAPPWDPNFKAADRSEPILFCVDYGKGRTFQSTLGHADYSMECVGFITTFLRGCEWAATGKVSIEVPEDFPNKDVVQKRKSEI